MMPQQKPPRSGSQFKPPTSFSPGGAMPNKKTSELKDNALQRALAATKTRSLTEAPSVNALSSSLLDATAIFLWGLGLLILMIWTRNLVHSAAEGIAVGEYRARLWVDARRTNIKGAFDRRRDWARHVFWSLHSDTKLEKVLRKRNDGVERLINRAQTLYEQTERFETSNWPALHMYGRFLRKRAVHYTAEAIAMQKKIDRLSPLFARIISDRQDRRAAGMLESARRLCEEIAQANDVAATPALAELYKLRTRSTGMH
jgi:hypothetical protein